MALVFNISAILLAFMALIALLYGTLSGIGGRFNSPSCR
ncbi:hypothetical protein DZA65_00502 [Dickeya dianthicola]|nr:hypothetical protein DDI_0273 [Dickeya dianthicola RNS04.9]AYC17416.1 hypothetical protein DZA65_00502 [Dickeya dianthicola]